MTDIDNSAENSEDLMKQSPKPEIKMCMVHLEKIDVKEYIYNYDSSDEDLPPLVGLSRTEQKTKSSNKELLEEHKNLAKNIQECNLSNNNIEEKMKILYIDKIDEGENVSLSPASVTSEEKDMKVFFVNDTLQYFNIYDVTLEQCGYSCRNENLTEYEKTMLSFKRVELESVLSSFLFSSNIFCISDIKSFVTFLLRNLSVHTDVAGVEACYKVLNIILEKHPKAKTLNFSSAEIFMLLFNYGIDIDSFMFLKKRMDIQRFLEEPKDKSKSKIPENWMCNLKTTLNAVIILITNCEFKLKYLCDIIIYFLWLSLDSSLLCENIFSTVRECISVCLDHVPTDKWSKVMREVARTFITEDFLHSQNQWSYVYHVADSVPVTSKRGLELRKYISFLALTEFGKTELSKERSKHTVEVKKNLDGFSLRELQTLLQWLVHNGSDAIVNFASKFLNICISHLEATDEDLQELCNILESSESALNDRAHEAKAYFLKINSRLKIKLGQKSLYKVVN